METPKQYQIVVSGRATRTLVSHASFLAQVSPNAAQRLTESFKKAANSLEEMPQRCPWFVGDYIPRNTYRYILFEKRYMILFQVKDDVVYIECVLDCRQNYQWLIP